MNSINLMGLRVAGMTAIVFVVLFALFWTGRTLLVTDNQPASPQTPGLTERTKDTDHDGMADLYETNFYGTNPQAADTDGDGASDLDEVVAGHDPLIPGPDDASKPATGSQVANTDTFTGQYLASLPDNAARADILDQVKLEAFVADHKGPLLPPVSITTSPAAGKEAISAYLDSVSSSHNKQLGIVTSTDIESAFRILVNTRDAKPLQTIVNLLDQNLKVLGQVVAPEEVADLHTNMVAATTALKLNSERLLYVNQDFVGGLIGAKNIEELGPVFQGMAQQIKALEGKYKL